MPPPIQPAAYQWLRSGNEIFPALLAAIASARKSIRFETYTWRDDEIGRRFREALVAARRRGVTVRVLIDSFGSFGLSAEFWQPLTEAGGEARWFNPIGLERFGFRDHRKMLVCDGEVAFVGGFNVSNVYEGDGISQGWYDLGLKVTSALAVQLAAAFDEIFARADFKHKRFTRLRPSAARRIVPAGDCELLLSGPGRGPNPFVRALRDDLARARNVRIIAAYFLPTRRIRRALEQVAQRGGQVQLIFPAKSDVLISQLACQSQYRRLLRAGVEIYEYQPQILHAKLIIIDRAIYAGSSNLDPRSLRINYELVVRIADNPKLLSEAQAIFAGDLGYCRRIELDAWRASRTWWRRLKQRWAYFLLARVDPYVARWQYRRLPR